MTTTQTPDFSHNGEDEFATRLRAWERGVPQGSRTAFEFPDITIYATTSEAAVAIREALQLDGVIAS